MSKSRVDLASRLARVTMSKSPASAVAAALLLAPCRSVPLKSQKLPYRPADEQRHAGEFRSRILSQKLPNLREKLTRAVRLRYEIIAARRSGFLFISAQGVRCNRNNWYRA